MPRIVIPETAQSVLKKDPVMDHLIGSVELNFPPSRGHIYEDLIEAIVYQQISIKAAKSIFEKFTGHFGGVVPAPEELATAVIEELRVLGLSGQKASYIRNIAEYFHERNLTHDQLAGHDDDTLIKLLTEIKGVGVWTVQMILIFSLGRPDVFPSKDYGIQAAMRELYGIGDTSPRRLMEEMQRIASRWRPYSTYATLVLWGWKRKQMGL